MGLTDANVLYGPFNLSLKNVTPTEVYGRTGLRHDVIKFKVETKEGSQEIEDGREVFWNNGRRLAIEIIFSEMNTTDLASIESSAIVTAEIYIREKAKTITISNPDKIFAHVDENYKTRIVIYKTGDIASTMADLMSVA